MTTADRSFVIAVFKENNQAQQAIQDLLNAGFNRDQIRYSVRRSGGGIADDLTNMGIRRQEADFYNREFEQGGIVVTVHTNTQQQQAFNLLRKDGGYDFNTNEGQATNYAAPATGVSLTASTPIPNVPGNVAANAAVTSAPGGLTGEREIQLRAETLQPETRWVRAGEVDISKQVVSEQKTIDVPVTHEEIVIEHHPVSGQPQVSSTPVPANENETITVKREELHVERQGDVRIKDTTANNPAEQG